MTKEQERNDFAEKLRPLNAESWQAWRMGERESDPIALEAPETLDEAVTQALAGLCWHPKDTLAVLYTHAGRNKRTLRLYTIKTTNSRLTYREARDGGAPVRVPGLEAKPLLETAVAAFAPVERFDAFRDDPVGRDLTLVSQ